MRANQVDLDLALESLLNRGVYRILNVFQNFCIGKVLLYLAATVEAADQNSRSTANNMDKTPRDIYYLASDNTNTAENIGSHTLMAKDSVRKLPLREETDTFARFAVATALSALARQVAAPGQVNRCVDWGELLRRLLCHPAQAPNDWAKKMLAGSAVTPGTFEPKLISRQEADKIRLDGAKLTADLEQKYRQLYLEAAALWKKEVP
jgi:hypothetical protein